MHKDLKAAPQGEIVNTPAIGITVHCPLDDKGRAIVLQAFVDSTAPIEVLHAMLDKCAVAGERQAARVELPKIRRTLAQREKLYKRSYEDLARVDAELEAIDATASGRAAASGKRNPKDSAQTLAHKNNANVERGRAVTTIERLSEDINDDKAEITRLEELLKGA